MKGTKLSSERRHKEASYWGVPTAKDSSFQSLHLIDTETYRTKRISSGPFMFIKGIRSQKREVTVQIPLPVAPVQE